MIRSLESALEVYPALGKVMVACSRPYPPPCHRGSELVEVTLGDVANCAPEDWTPNLAAILTCDDQAGVGEMVGATDWCSRCGPLADYHSGICLNCGQSFAPVTHRIFLWTGEMVDWGANDHVGVLWRKAEGLFWYRPLTAVVLVGEPGTVYRDHDGHISNVVGGINPELRDEAAQACAEAGVQFVIPGHPEKGRLEL